MLPYLTKAVSNLFHKPSTEQFPAGDPPKAAEGYRGRISYDPEKCVNCGMCIRVCAPQCMERTIEKLENGDQKITFTFDMTSCTFCSMCADFCARHAITLTDDYMIVGTKPEDFLVTGSFVKKAPPPKPRLTPEQIAEMKAKAEAAKKAKAEAAAKAAAAAAADNG
ncbi:MAG: 4Fe-4S binding protein [Clostridiales bacterium]|nr:4Fe-4S binding protein [Clostridiales bacterium]